MLELALTIIIVIASSLGTEPPTGPPCGDGEGEIPCEVVDANGVITGD